VIDFLWLFSYFDSLPSGFEIQFYEDERGNRPALVWLKRLDLQQRVRIQRRLDRVRDGNLGDSRNLGDGVSEFRFFFGPGYRLYYGLDKGTIILLLNGGSKGTQNKDISKAKQLWKDYLEEQYG
jgi:putative addiction module killer protein